MDLSLYWKTIVDALQDGVMIVDTLGRIVAVNPAVEHLTGYTADELIGQTCRVLDCTGCKIIGKGAGKKILGLTPEALKKMVRYRWPGKVRELRNAVEYAFVLCPSGGIDVRHLPPKILGAVSHGPPPSPTVQNKDNDLRKELIGVLRRTSGNQSEAARLLGVSRITVWKRIKKYGIDLKTEIRELNG